MNATILIKTFNRPNALLRLLESCSKHLPDMPILVVDDGDPYANDIINTPTKVRWLHLPFDVGISEGRNRGVDAIDTKYFILMDDDFVVPEKNPVAESLEILEGGKWDIICYRLSETKGHSWHSWAGRFQHHKKARILKRKPMHLPDDGAVHQVDIGLNSFAAKTDVVRRIRWDDDLKVGEHWDFFFRGEQQGMRVGVLTRHGLLHNRTREGGGDYKKYRSRVNRYRNIAVNKLGLWQYHDGCVRH